MGAGCTGAAVRSGGTSAPPTAATSGGTAAQPAQPAAFQQVKRPAFDSANAWAMLVKQCDFGPRPVGSPAHEKMRSWLLDEMRKYADVTAAQDFTYKGHPLTNVIGVFNRDAKRQVLLCAHWDTRPTADQELDPAKKKLPILGASDGASGVAVLLELAREFKAQKPAVGVVMVMLDGEDFGSFEKDEGVLLGAKYFAAHHKGYHPDLGVLLDMVGDKSLDIRREPNSQNFAPGTNDKFFRIAKELGYGKSIIDEPMQYPITDDHIPLNQANIPTIDIIDFDYAYWHTLDDTPEHCSAESLAAVGNTLAELVYREQ